MRKKAAPSKSRSTRGPSPDAHVAYRFTALEAERFEKLDNAIRKRH
jgi:hypothetical protein